MRALVGHEDVPKRRPLVSSLWYLPCKARPDGDGSLPRKSSQGGRASRLAPTPSGSTRYTITLNVDAHPIQQEESTMATQGQVGSGGVVVAIKAKIKAHHDCPELLGAKRLVRLIRRKDSFNSELTPGRRSASRRRRSKRISQSSGHRSVAGGRLLESASKLAR